MENNFALQQKSALWGLFTNEVMCKQGGGVWKAAKKCFFHDEGLFPHFDPVKVGKHRFYW